MKRLGPNGKNDYQIKYENALDTVRSLHAEARLHPKYEDADLFVNSKLDHAHYEMGTVLMISKDRYDFDPVYEFEYVYRGGLIETKLGDDYILYGFTFD